MLQSIQGNIYALTYLLIIVIGFSKWACKNIKNTPCHWFHDTFVYGKKFWKKTSFQFKTGPMKRAETIRAGPI